MIITRRLEEAGLVWTALEIDVEVSVEVEGIRFGFESNRDG
jgi:hypothetical protein